MNDVVLVTGAGRGMGLACARRFAAHATLVLADLDPASAERAASDLERTGARAHALAGDVAEAPDVARIVDAAARLGRVVAVAHAAGVSPTMADWRRILEVDLCGTARVAEAVRPVLAAGGALVCFASIAGHLVPASDGALALLDAPLAPDFLQKLEPLVAAGGSGLAYGFAKRGVIRLCERLAPAFGAGGARILSVSPGLILDTPQGQQELARQPAMRAMLERTPLARGGRAEDVAAAVEWLCLAPGAAFLTGTDLRVDGGVTAALQHASPEAGAQRRAARLSA